MIAWFIYLFVYKLLDGIKDDVSIGTKRGSSYYGGMISVLYTQ